MFVLYKLYFDLSKIIFHLPATFVAFFKQTFSQSLHNMSTIIYNRFDEEVHPPRLSPDYKSTVLRAPTKPLIVVKQSLSESTGPLFGDFNLCPLDQDLTKK